MITLFRLIDLLATISQGVILFVIVNSFCHTLRVKWGKWLLPVLFVALAYFWTWFIVDGTFKIVAHIILVISLALAFYQDCVFNIIASAIMGILIPGTCEALALIFVGLFTDTITVDISGVIFASLPAYITCIFINIIAGLLLHFCYMIFAINYRKMILLSYCYLKLSSFCFTAIVSCILL